MTNSATLVYIFKKYNITVHVYTLLFIDALLCTCGNLNSVIILTLNLWQVLPDNSEFCSVLLFSVFLPTLYGALLICLVAIIRYVLATKSAQNIQVPNKVVSTWALSVFVSFVLITGSYVVISIGLDRPVSLIAESCARHHREPRPGKSWTIDECGCLSRPASPNIL